MPIEGIIMKVAIVGSRSFTSYPTLKRAMSSIKGITEIVSAGAKGADTLGEMYAKETGVPCRIFYPDWKLHGKYAGFLRNEDIVRAADVVVAFWDMESKGTKHTINTARKLGKKVYIVDVRPDPFLPIFDSD